MVRMLLVALVVVTATITPVQAASVSAATPQSVAQMMAQAKPYLSLNSDKTIHVAPGYKGHYDFAALNASIRAGKALQPATSALATRTAASYSSWGCWYWFYVPHWALDAFAWYVIIEGGLYATAGMFADGTIVGIPVGVVLQAIGLWLGVTGSFMLWYVDTYYQGGVWVCVTH